MRIVIADTEHLLPVQAHGVHRTRFRQRIELPVHCRQTYGRPRIGEPPVQFLRRDEALARTQLLQQRILLPRVPCDAMLSHIHALYCSESLNTMPVHRTTRPHRRSVNEMTDLHRDSTTTPRPRQARYADGRHTVSSMPAIEQSHQQQPNPPQSAVQRDSTRFSANRPSTRSPQAPRPPPGCHRTTR